MNRKALSPIITTILLILLAIVLVVIILLWANGLMKEQVSKFEAPIEDSCGKVQLQASISGNNVLVNNLGDVYVLKIGIRVSGAGSSEVEYLEANLGQGASATLPSKQSLDGSVELIPVLLGTSKKTGEVKEFTCLDNPVSLE